MKQSKSFSNIIYGGVAVEAMNTFATGPFLIAYALLLGATNIQIGFLGGIGYLSYFMHILTAWILEKKNSPQKISIISSLLSSPCYLIAALLAFFPSQSSSTVLIILFSLTHLSGGIAGGAWYPWMKVIIPTKIMGRFFAVRMKYMMIAQIICSAIGALIIYFFEQEHPKEIIFSYSILLFLSFIFRIYSVFTFTKVQDKKVTIEKGVSFWEKIVKSIHRKEVMYIVCLLSFLNFSMCFATPFFSVFMLKFLSFSTPVVIFYTCISQISYILSSKYWGNKADKSNCFSILNKGIFLFILTILLFLLSSYTNSYISYALLTFAHIILGFSTFSFKLVVTNIPIQYVPKKDAPVYISIINVCKSFSAVISGICAGAILSLFEKIALQYTNLSSTSQTSTSWLAFWLLSIIFSFITITYGKKHAKTF